MPLDSLGVGVANEWSQSPFETLQKLASILDWSTRFSTVYRQCFQVSAFYSADITKKMLYLLVTFAWCAAYSECMPVCRDLNKGRVKVYIYSKPIIFFSWAMFLRNEIWSQAHMQFKLLKRIECTPNFLFNSFSTSLSFCIQACIQRVCMHIKEKGNK